MLLLLLLLLGGCVVSIVSLFAIQQNYIVLKSTNETEMKLSTRWSTSS